ncbi:MAG: relaxase/mobilization nuclease domain-containing protein [Pseudoruegeria sp.]
MRQNPPTKADQLQAVQDTLKRLGVSDRQAVVIGHNDTDHTHVHVMVNRVCPATGKAANMGNDQIKLSEWALQYRKERGEEHFCPQREENQKRRKGEFVKDGSMSRKEWVAWKKSQSKDIWDSFRADRAMASASRKPQYDALWRQKEERFALRRDEIKALYKPIWRDVFKRQSQELKDFDAGLTRRITFALAQPKGKVLGVVQAVIAKGDLRVDFVRKQEAERAEISGGQKARIVDASREINKAWKYDRDQLKTLHKAQDQQVYDNTQVKSNEVWQDRSLDKSGQDFEQSADRRRPANEQNRKTFESEFGSDKEAMAEARKVQEEIKKRNRQRKGGRGRNRDDGGRDMEP